ncbi:MAG: DUF1549 and DUF1553 domain-containing protein [Planctomycetaceae bacterium]|nr:DUF1549 and DUF1553 domain-containing protein [Planctomycetaceae bacterium]
MRPLLRLVLATLCLGSVAAFAQSDAEIVAEIDWHLAQGWKDNGVQPSSRAEDGEYARRAALDIVGHVPSLPMLVEFLTDESADRRLKYVDRLLADGDYARNWSNIWGNLLVGRANRQNRGARDDLDRWLNAAFARNLGYDKFAGELISATGSSDDVGAIGFIASHLNENGVPATAITARLFLGLQVQCTQCHNHPFNDWKQSQFWGLNAFFRGTQRQNLNGRNTIYLSDDVAQDIVFFKKRSGTMEAVVRQFVDGTPPPESVAGPRHQLAALVTDPSRPDLSRAIVNRMWSRLLGQGFTRPVDDMGPHNPPSHPELLDALAGRFRQGGFDLKRLIRWIAASEAYNLTSAAIPENVADDPAAGNVPVFSRCYVKPFTAEQLYDSLLIVTEADKSGRSFEQAEGKRTEWLQQFVQAFGTDENDEADTFNGTVPQALVLMNGELVRNALSGGQGSFLRSVYDGRISALAKLPTKQLKTLKLPTLRSTPGRIEVLYLTALSRKPNAGELHTLDAAYAKAGGRDPVAGLQDVFWAILNSNEFILNH